MEDRKPSEERRSSESRLRRTLLRFAIRAQDAKDLADEVNRRIQESIRRLVREDLPTTNSPESGDVLSSENASNNCAETLDLEGFPPT